MANLPKFVTINEEGIREGFQIEKGPITTDQKVALIDAVSETGIRQIQTVSFVNPARVPGWADAEEVVRRFTPKEGVNYTGLSLNDKGLKRALATGRLSIRGNISMTASEQFLLRNQRRTLADNIEAQRGMIRMYQENGVVIERGSIMSAFGCNFQGDIPVQRVLEVVQDIMGLAQEFDVKVKVLSLADTMAWATPDRIQRVVGAVRDAYPDLKLSLHLHDTRGMAIANAFAGLQMGVDIFDASIAGLGGCPFAAHAGASGNICTEDLVFMLNEMGIETGIDLDKVVEAARLAESIVGRFLPGKVKEGGSLAILRDKLQAA